MALDDDEQTLLYVDRQLLHEVSSPQAFEGLRAAGLSPRRPRTHLAVADHAVPTRDRDRPIGDPQARAQVALLEANCADASIEYLALGGAGQGIVHVIGPEQGLTRLGTAETERAMADAAAAIRAAKAHCSQSKTISNSNTSALSSIAADSTCSGARR